MQQGQLFDTGDAVPDGWAYETDFIDAKEEADLIAFAQALPLAEMRYKHYVARRRGVSFGGHYDFDANRLMPSPALPEALHPLRARAAAWLGRPADAFTHVLVAEYRPGTPLGWHRDVPDFDEIVGVSLGDDATMAFRRYPPRTRRGDPLNGRLELRVAPRSIYRITGSACWDWQHAIIATAGLRYSITLRTQRSALPQQRNEGSATREA